MTRVMWSLSLLDSIKMAISLAALRKLSLISTITLHVTQSHSPFQLHRPHQRPTWSTFSLLLPCSLWAQVALLLRTANAFTKTDVTAALL